MALRDNNAARSLPPTTRAAGPEDTRAFKTAETRWKRILRRLGLQLKVFQEDAQPH